MQIPSFIQNTKYYFERVYRLGLKRDHQKLKVWKDLKRLHQDAEWHSGIYENEVYLETKFKLSEDRGGQFFYSTTEDEFICKVSVVEDFPSDLTTDIFVLASHFNNLLKNGVVSVHVQNRLIMYEIKSKLVVPLLYTGEIHHQILTHYNTAKDVHWAFEKLIQEGEYPAIIISDLLKMNDEKEK